MSRLTEILPKFEIFASYEELRWTLIFEEISNLETILKNCPSLWGRNIYFEELAANLCIIEGKIFLIEIDGSKKPLTSCRKRDCYPAYLALHKFLELIMEGEG